jgi:hypothetical protein
MLGSVFSATKRAYSHYSSWIGVVSALVGVLNDALGRQLLLPTTGWWLIAIGATGFTAVQIQWELDEERDQTRKPEPTVSLEKLIEHIVGTNDMGQQGVPQKTADALVAIREKARLGLLSTWGRKDANQSNLSFYPLEPIDAGQWTHAHIDYLEYLKTTTCASQNATLPGATDHYSDLHFDEKQVEKLWRRK